MTSDHCPLLLSMAFLMGAKRRFRFASFSTRVEGFQEAVAEAWKCNNPMADPIRRLHTLLTTIGHALQCWSKRQCGSIRQQTGMAKEAPCRLDLAEENQLLSPWERWLRMELKKKMLGLCSFERTIARQRRCISWLREGDANTWFFHLHANHRRCVNFIASLKVADS